MRDIQIEKAAIELNIDKVGVTDLILPLKIYSKEMGTQPVTAHIEILASLSSKERGTHMSRMVRIMNDYVGKVISFKTISDILNHIQNELVCKNVHLQIKFTLFRKKYAPVTKHPSYVDYDCWISASKKGKNQSISLGTTVLITSLCPISKSISKFGAHNQRGAVTITANIINKNIWFEDFIKLIEQNSSCDLFGVLKREDEKFVTEKAYDNAKIVEDIVREIAYCLGKNKHIDQWSVSCKNFESIHTHNAFAEIGGKNGR